MNTIAEAREYLAQNANTKKGCHCPVCNRYTKVYHRQIVATMAKIMIIMYVKERAGHGSQWFHMRKDILAPSKEPLTNDYGKLEYWGLLEKSDEQAGYWRLTMKGTKFVEGEKSVPRIAYVFNNKPLAFSADHVEIKDVIGKGFDINAVMGRVK